MSLNGKFRDITREDLLREADRFGVRSPARILADVASALDAFAQFAEEAGLPPARMDQVAKDFHLVMAG
jgi:serine/threonine-protein kinase HipA